jgi:hypothetical protein
MKPSIQIITVSVVFVGTIATLGVAIERQRAPVSSGLLSGPPLAVKAGATTLCVARQFVDPHELRAATDRSPPRRVDLAAFSADLAGFTPERYQDSAVHGRYQSAPDWVRITLWPQDPPPGLDLEPACGPARCSVRTRLDPDGVRFDYSFPKTMMADWPKLHANALSRVGEWAKDRSCLR